MNIDQLVAMANQIGSFFLAYPDAELAKKEIVSHIKRFWALSMRQQIMSHVADQHGQGLTPLVKDAIRQNTALLS